MTTDASQHPANVRGRVLDRLAAAHRAGNHAAYETAQADLVKVNKYEAEYLGIPAQYVDPVTGRWEELIPESMCRACWQTIAGPVVAVGCDGSCLHYHPDCVPRYADLPPRPLMMQPPGVRHPRPSCRSTLPYFLA